MIEHKGSELAKRKVRKEKFVVYRKRNKAQRNANMKRQNGDKSNAKLEGKGRQEIGK